MSSFFDKFDVSSAGVARKANPAERPMRSSVDAARTTDENKRHWANADSLGPNATFNESTRQKVRNRGRYETLNNSYCHGLVRSLAYDLIGTGPRPQLGIPGDKDGKAAKRVEANYAKWARAVGLARKYRLMEKCAASAGEVFGVLTTNRRIANPVKLDLRLLEAEQCATPWDMGLRMTPYLCDGILFDENWMPVEYYFLRYHPGETYQTSYATVQSEFERVSARYVIHWFSQERPGQMRGIPRITASLPLFSQLRRYTLATLTAAEFASMLAGIMKTDVPAPDSAGVAPANWELFEMARGALLTLPAGWEADQFEPNQPTATYKEFKNELLNEAGRGPGAPLNVVTGNSSGYNFSSGRLDHVPYHAGIRIDRDDFSLTVDERVFMAWEEEARAWSAANPSMPPLVDPNLPPLGEWTVIRNWDGFGSIDPVKDANADDIRLKDGTTSYSETLAEYGQDWRAHFEQIAAEKQYAESLGLSYPLLAKTQASTEETETEESAEETEEKPVNGHRLNGHLIGGRN